MIINPAIIALVLGSLLITAFAFYALFTALRILRHWDLSHIHYLQLSAGI